MALFLGNDLLPENTPRPVGAYLRQHPPLEKLRVGIKTIVAVMDLKDLYGIILQEVVQDIRAAVAIQALSVIPHAVKAKDLLVVFQPLAELVITNHVGGLAKASLHVGLEVIQPLGGGASSRCSA